MLKVLSEVPNLYEAEGGGGWGRWQGHLCPSEKRSLRNITITVMERPPLSLSPNVDRKDEICLGAFRFAAATSAEA